jgi:hypothetical protein
LDDPVAVGQYHPVQFIALEASVVGRIGIDPNAVQFSIQAGLRNGPADQKVAVNSMVEMYEERLLLEIEAVESIDELLLVQLEFCPTRRDRKWPDIPVQIGHDNLIIARLGHRLCQV